MHYHGTPITPRAVLNELAGRCFCVSYARPQDVTACHQIGQSVMLDNGAFSAWRRHYVPDWDNYYAWCEPWLEYRTTWAVIPDVIEGDAEANDALIAQWPFGHRGAPVWHMHEPIGRLLRLAGDWPLVCIGSSGEYANLGTPSWGRRMDEAFNRLCGDGPSPVALHMLRGLDYAGSDYPFASADSTNIAQNHARNRQRGKDAKRMADEIDGRQCPARWKVRTHTPSLFEVAA